MLLGRSHVYCAHMLHCVCLFALARRIHALRHPLLMRCTSPLQSSAASAPPSVRQLEPSFQPPTAPTSARFSAQEIIGSAWRHIVGGMWQGMRGDDTLYAAHRIRLVPALTDALKEAAAATEVDAKGEVLMHLHFPADGASAALVDRVQAQAERHVRELGERR